MIQRIQTLYLLAVAALFAATLFVPLAWFGGPSANYTLYAFSLVDGNEVATQTPWYLGALLALAAMIPFVTIFLFRRRLVQIRLCVAEIVLIIGAIVIEGLYYYRFTQTLTEAGCEVQGLKAGAILPLLALLFTWLAARAIFRDEMLVRAADRIR